MARGSRPRSSSRGTPAASGCVPWNAATAATRRSASARATSPEEDPERPGRSLVTTHHEVIKQWAEARGGKPATVEGTEHGDHLGVLRFDFGGETANLRHVSWDEWFATFDARKLNFIYQEERSDGEQSNFFRLESPQREDG